MHIPAYFKLYEIYNNTIITKNILLEPLCCIFRIILLIYKEKGTKISFYNNSITYNSPNILQGLIRTFYGDKRDDIHNLYFGCPYPPGGHWTRGFVNPPNMVCHKEAESLRRASFSSSVASTLEPALNDVLEEGDFVEEELSISFC